MQKRSFFQKLTGSYPFDEDEEIVEKKPGKEPERKTPVPPEPEEEEGELTIDVYQTPDAIILQTLVAGVRPEDLDISITREMVTIKGKREDTRGVRQDDFFYRELYWGHFSRTVLLPQEVEPEEADASEKHGLLTLHLPKINKDRIQKVRVRSGQ